MTFTRVAQAGLSFSDLCRAQNSGRRSMSLLAGLMLCIFFVAACRTQPNQIFIEVDGTRQSVSTEAGTVREALAEADVELGPLDEVTPDLYVQLEPGMVIVVTRVREEIETEREIVPFERQTVVNEALPRGETRLAQLGVNGEDEISIRVVYEDDTIVSRTEISRQTIIEPVPEILVVGPQDSLPPIPIEGTIAYISNGNAWLMRDNSGSRRALTTAGDLDGRVFSLSPDGRQLLYTTHLTDEIELPLNQLWLASTTIVGEAPVMLDIQGVLQAEWSPVFSQSLVVYSTAERTASPPGWQANNDLWLLDLSEPDSEPAQLLAPNTRGLYPWWGATFAWSPDGTQLAYARADQIGLIKVEAGDRPVPSDNVIPLLDFAPLQTFSDWIWVPNISWSPDGRFIAATVHGPPIASEPAEESQVFDLWLISADGEISVKVAEQVGMWTNPSWSAAGIGFGVADEPLQSVNSRYSIYLIDRDGSNRRQLFPFKEELGVQLPELVWDPEGQNLLFVYNGNLFTVSHTGGLPRQLTIDTQATHPRWALAQPTTVITGTISITGSQTVTTSGAITATSVISTTPAAGQEPQQTPPATPTPVLRPLTATPPLSPTIPAATSIIPPTATGTPQPTITATVQESSSPSIEATGTITTPTN